MLGKYQRDFLDVVLGNTSDTDPVDYLKPAGKLTQAGVIEVYKADYGARMQEALGKNFEATWLLMGDVEFFNHSREYIISHPSNLTNLTTYGALFPDFLKAADLEEDIVIMACFERRFWELFNLKGNPPVLIQAETLPGLRFDLAADLYLSHSSYKLHELWKRREQADEGLSMDEFEGEQFLAVYKAGEVVTVREISEVQHSLLEALDKLKTMALLFEKVSQMKIVTIPEDWAVVFEILSYCPRISEEP